MSASWREASSGMLTLTNVGEPPPPYTAEVECQGQLPVSVSWEPPPMYDVAIVPKPYEVNVEEQWKSLVHTEFPMGRMPILRYPQFHQNF